MKRFWRVSAGLLTVLLFCTLTLWRHEALPDMSGVTAAWQKASDRIDRTAAGIGDAISNVISRPTEAPSGDKQQIYADYDLSAPVDATLEEAICKGLAAREAKIDISAHQLTVAELENAMAQVQYSHPEFFYVASRYSYTTAGGIVRGVEPEYQYNEAETARMSAVYDATIAGITAGVDPAWSDFDKALYLHDYFVRNYTYDYTYTIRDAATFFEKKTGVCQAYMLALIAAGNAVGLEVLPVTSSEMLHAWNLVRVDGEWYHVDITWDDSAPNPAETSYLYFLQSDNGLATTDNGTENPHRKWTSPVAATATKYDSAAYHGSATPMLKSGDTYYCVVSTTEGRTSARQHGAIFAGTDVTAMTAVHWITAEWMADVKNCYVACFSGICLYEGKLIYNTATSVRMYDPASGKDTTLGMVTLSGRSIYGIYEIAGRTVTLIAGNSPQDTDFKTISYIIIA